MTTLQQQARALGDQTRHSIFRYITEAARDVDVAELTDHVGLHHNAIRQHLARLVAAGLVIESTAPAKGRGRPRLLYTADPSAHNRWGTTGPYEQLAQLLSEIIRSGDDPIDVGRRAATNQRLGSRTSDGTVADLVTDMARRGFNPTVDQRGSRIELTLNTCPFATVAITDPTTVCDIHLGLAEGTADSIPGLVIDELIRNDPRQEPCLLHCHFE